MKQPPLFAPVVVGVDGSEAAINAALWAADEAISREAPLRIVHVTRPKALAAEAEADDDLSLEYAETSLRAAAAAVKATGKPVKFEPDIVWGSAADALINESWNAAMVCVGSVGIGAIARRLLGSTATALATKALCPVAIIRTPHHTPPSGPDWIVTAVNDDPDNDIVVEYALREARLRRAPVLALGAWQHGTGEPRHGELDCRVHRWRPRYPDVHIYPISTRAGISRFLAENRAESVQLVVLGAREAAQATPIIGPHSHPLVAHGRCSVLIVR